TRPDILGVGVDPVDLDEAAARVLGWASGRAVPARYVCVTGVHGVMVAEEDGEFRSILNRADMVVPDGMPLAVIGRLAGWPSMGRVFGPDFMLRVCAGSVPLGLRHFFYGGREGVAEDLARRMQSVFPGLRVAGWHCPPFSPLGEGERDRVAELVNESAPDLVWVGLSTPKQERWMAEITPLLCAGVCLGVGAAFDYNTGRLRRAPRWMQAGCLEWVYRLIQEPTRLYRRYLWNNPRFLVKAAAQAAGLRRGRRKEGVRG
ncbi:MAG: WecB/TagA/CpsF family glycosyltransferase, partial [Bacteroidota bacterium]